MLYSAYSFLHSWQNYTAGRTTQLAELHSWQNYTAGRTTQLAELHSWQNYTAGRTTQLAELHSGKTTQRKNYTAAKLHSGKTTQRKNYTAAKLHSGKTTQTANRRLRTKVCRLAKKTSRQRKLQMTKEEAVTISQLLINNSSNTD